MLRRTLVILSILALTLPIFVSYNSKKTNHFDYQKTTFDNFDMVKLSQNKSVHFKAISLIELDKNFWQARKPIINEDIFNERKTTTIADLGIIRQNNDIIELYDNVSSKSSDPTMSELRTDHLILKKDLSEYETKGYTILKNNNQVLTGYDFTFDQFNNKFIIPKQSKLVYNR